ncbi:785_t:CDS:1 [Cetraspora pellucida]|uniref:785_t:CDS:1 n=1 Tax=Cetraspora pellucida TaxID=1433469 RepID=A0ACA9KBF1_9GLOM|nr:785_t:CDS:1 [Cetraspora pellucida]
MSKKKLVDKLQDNLFYHGDDEDETIIEVVLDYLKDNQKLLQNKDITDKFREIFKDLYVHKEYLEDLKKSYSELKEQDNEFDIESITVFNQLKHDFETDVCDETFRRLGRKNPNIKDEKIFNQIKEDVHNTISSYASVLSIHDNEEGIEKYENSEEYKYLVNKETLRQYRDYKSFINNKENK